VLALGIQFNPGGSLEDQTSYLWSKAIKWATQVRSGHLRKHEAWYALNMTIMKSIDYPLLATTMSYEQLQQVMSPITKIGLVQSKVSQKIASSVTFSTIKYQGLGIKHPYVTQGIRKFLLFIQEYNSIPLTNHLLD
jgi:hypothetical protein